MIQLHFSVLAVRATIAEKMSEDEEWTPPTEAELKVLAFSKISFDNIASAKTLCCWYQIRL